VKSFATHDLRKTSLVYLKKKEGKSPKEKAPALFALEDNLGSVLAQMAFPLHASEITDKSETGRENHILVPAESSHFFPFKKAFSRQGQNVRFFGKDVTKNVTR